MQEDVFFKVVKVSLSYNYWALRKWRIKIGKFLFFLQKKSFFSAKEVHFDVPHALGVLGRTSVKRITPGPPRRFSEILGRRDILSFGNVKFLIHLNFFAYFAYFRLIKHTKPAKQTYFSLLNTLKPRRDRRTGAVAQW